MTRFLSLSLLSLLAAFSLGCAATSDGSSSAHAATASHDHHSGDEAPETADIVDTAVAAGSFETLVAAVQAAGLVETLKGEGPFTVFAPTDEAFAALPEGTVESLLLPENRERLVEVLTYHVVPGEVRAADVVAMESAPTVQGNPLSIAVNDSGVRVAGASVVQADIDCSNGVIHVVDQVMIP